MKRIPGRILSFAVFFMFIATAMAEEPRHGLSVFGDLKYEKDFSHFDYVNPEAPKGGTLSQVGPEFRFNAGYLTFNSLNGFILKGDAAQGLELVFDTLMVRAWDEPDAVYGLIAKSAQISADGNQVTFHLREQARFHDGTPLTAEDVVFSFRLLKKEGHPLIARNLREVDSFSAPDAHTVVVVFTGRQTRALPVFIAEVLPVFSKAYYSTHPFNRSTLDPPSGSGPYTISSFKAGSYIEYERVRDYWAKDLNVSVGKWNFDTIRFEYFRDRTAQFEAFKAGEYLFREEFTSRQWTTGYTFPAVRDGRVKKLEIPDNRPSGAQGWFINTRREKFSDVRVREALSLAFDFEWTNRNQFHNLYRRTASYFENSPMKARGLPSAKERALLEPYRETLPASVFADAVTPPVSDGSGRDRKQLRKAARLLDEAGWTVRNGTRRNTQGKSLEIEFLTDTPTFERIIAPFADNLRFLGIEARIRLVDAAQYQDRVKTYDFDIVSRRFSLSNTPGVEIRSYWSSAFANIAGGHNLSGIVHPAVDALVDGVLAATNREDQIVAARALDRVLRAGHYWIPHWYKASYALAFRDIYARPDIAPRYRRGVLETWWVDPEKQARAETPD